MEDQVDLEVWTREHVMAWKREAADHRSRVLAHCKSCDYGPGVAAFIAQLENERWSMHGLGQIWQTASSWKGYCQLLAISAAILGNEPCLRVLHAGWAATRQPVWQHSKCRWHDARPRRRWR